MTNLKLALRTLLKSPFVTAVAVLSLALGIGANAAIFSLFDQILIQALPVREPGELVNLVDAGPKPGSISCNQGGPCDWVFSYPMFRDLQREQDVFTDIAAHRSFGANLAYQGQTMNGTGMLVSGSYFPVLGVRPAIGRLLGPSDDETIGGHPVVVLSHAYWQNRLGGDPAMVNQTLIVNGQPMTVVGVAQRGFRGTTLGSDPQVFVPMSMRGLMNPGWEGFENRRSYWAYLFARLRPGVSVEQARTALNGIFRPTIQDVEVPLQPAGLPDEMKERFRSKEIALEPGARGQSGVHEGARAPLILLLSITGIVLLIACANIANLLLARGAGRSREMAVRLALGASQRRVLRQLLTESVLLGVMGGAVGLLVAQWTLAALATLMPPEAATTLDLGLDLRVVLFTAVLAVATGLLFGLFPALHSTRRDLIALIRANTGQLSAARAASRFRTTLVTAQIALSMALLASAGLFIRSLVNLSRVELGLETEDVVVFGVSPELNGYEPEQSRALFVRLEEELAAVPGVTGVAAALLPILAGKNWTNNVTVQGYDPPPGDDLNASTNFVGPGWFRTMGFSLLAGREFTESDVVGAGRVAVVNEAFARATGHGRDIVGKMMTEGSAEDGELDTEIVGLVSDAKYSDVKVDAPPQYFTPYRQYERAGFMTFYVRAAVPPEQVLRAVPPLVSRLDPNLPVEGLKTLERQVDELLAVDRMISTLATAFAALATVLAAVGLYGVLAYTVAQRTREIGVRMAIGASEGKVRGMVLRQVAKLVVVGGVIGVLAALALGRLAGSLLFGLRAWDPLVLLGAAVVLAAVAFGAGYLPARRASRVNPMEALRYE